MQKAANTFRARGGAEPLVKAPGMELRATFQNTMEYDSSQHIFTCRLIRHGAFETARSLTTENTEVRGGRGGLRVT
jgi:hypothetical protein